MSTKLKGGVVIPDSQGAHGLVQLLTFHNRAQLDLTYYSHSYDIDVMAGFDFLIVLSIADFEGVVKFYDAKQRQLPLLVHVDAPGVLDDYDHARAYPGVQVLAIRQAPIDSSPGATLEINLFGKIMRQLRDEL